MLIVLAGGLLPVGYQIFRMGYYGLLVPQTALAKDASGSKWGQGLIYLGNFTGPYALWIPAVLLIALGAVLAARRVAAESAVAMPPGSGLAGRVQSPAAVVRLHAPQRSCAGPVLDPPGRRFHARAGVAGARCSVCWPRSR